MIYWIGYFLLLLIIYVEKKKNLQKFIWPDLFVCLLSWLGVVLVAIIYIHNYFSKKV